MNSVALGLRVVHESDAVFPATAAHLAGDLAAGRLVTLDDDAPALRSGAGIFHLRDHTPSPAARAFLDILRAAGAERLRQEVAATVIARSPAKRRRSGTGRCAEALREVHRDVGGLPLGALARSPPKGIVTPPFAFFWARAHAVSPMNGTS